MENQGISFLLKTLVLALKIPSSIRFPLNHGHLSPHAISISLDRPCSRGKGGGDSNAIILPGKRRNKTKGKSQVHEQLRTKKNLKLTKCQKRKLNNIEVGVLVQLQTVLILFCVYQTWNDSLFMPRRRRRKALLLSKSIETLEKYKIQDDAYSLMWSSRNLSQVETVRERRRRAVQLSKVDLPMPLSDQPFKRKAAVSPSCEIEPDSDTIQSTKGIDRNNLWQPVTAERDVIKKFLLLWDLPKNHFLALDLVQLMDMVLPFQLRKLPTKLMTVAFAKMLRILSPPHSTDRVVESPKMHISNASNLADCPPQRGLTAPVVVHVSRKKEVENKRKDLPIVMWEQEIMEAINENSTVIICGKTGCGETTQVPQATSFMKLALVQTSLGVDVYEEQQRKVFSGQRISPENRISPQKLVLMSATLRVDDFVSGISIFDNPPPVIEIPTRQYPVTIIFSKRTEIVDYVGQDYMKREVQYLCRMLRKASKDIVGDSSKINMEKEVSTVLAENDIEENDTSEVSEAFEMHRNSCHNQTDRFSSYDEDHDDLDDIESDFSDDLGTDSDFEGADDVELLNQKTEIRNDLSEFFGEEGSLASLKASFEVLARKTTLNLESDDKQVVTSTSEGCSNQPISIVGEKRGGVGLCAGAMCVLPLYANLCESAQRCVFKEIKEGERLVVIATNVAETSLTIKGRAGRTGPGCCYRLYSSAAFNNIFPDFSIAEILREPVDGVVLLLKSMGVPEESKLREQLLQLVFNGSLCGLQQEFSWTHGTIKDVKLAWRVSSDKHPLRLEEEELLGKAICASWADRVAKHIERVSASEEDRKVHATRYQACMVRETVFLRRRSSVSRLAPEFLVYNPKPYYNPELDQIFSWVVPTFGPHRWQLPLHGLPITKDPCKVAVFAAAALLEGHVLPCLISVGKFLAASPASILRPEASGQRRAGNLLNKLKTRHHVKRGWDENPRELHSEILDWFQAGFRDQFEDLWAKMHHKVLLDPEERFPKRIKRAIKEK
ncbi:hypothetical protein RHGRI_007366 [Rhododendron griersonianum]|uniref:RNA helicase n=1 Tax=Rhododendron griersonianum TaxID=479676 RepID=A0AAV6KY97_9ERIC|nr:hypothetical protein RHGRI_007366 [Rhododendron griersonianum]